MRAAATLWYIFSAPCPEDDTMRMRVGWVLHRLAGDDRGVSAIEYAIIAALISVVIIVAVTSTGAELSEIYDEVAKKLKKVSGTGEGN